MTRLLNSAWLTIPAVIVLLAAPLRVRAEEAAETAMAPTPAVDTKALTLEDCRSLAILSNIDLQRSVIENRRTELSLWNEEGLYLPNLSFSLNHSHDSDSQSASLSLSGSSPFGTSISLSTGHGWDPSSGDSDITLSVTQPLLEGSTRTEKLDSLWKARVNAAVQRNLLERKIESILYEAHSKHIECIKQELTIKVNRRSLERTLRLYEATREKERLGAATVLDLADVESTLASRKIALANSQRALETALDNLKQFLNIDIQQEIRLASVSVDLEETEDETTRTRISVDENNLIISLETVNKETADVADRQTVFEGAFVDPAKAMKRALSNRLDLVNARLSQAKSYLDHITNRTGLQPDLDLSFSYTKSGSGTTSAESFPLDEEHWSVGINLSLPVGNRSDRTSFEKALLDYQNARLASRETEQNVRAEVRSVLRNLDTTCHDVLNYGLQVRAAGLGLESARVTYELGRTDFFRVLDAENALLSAQRSYIRTYLDYELLLSQLRLVIGDDSGRLAEMVRRGRELSRQLKEDKAPSRPEDAIRRLYLKGASPDVPFRLPSSTATQDASPEK